MIHFGLPQKRKHAITTSLDIFFVLHVISVRLHLQTVWKKEGLLEIV